MDGERRSEAKDFIFSFGLTLVGLVLLFIGSVTIVPQAKDRLSLPKSAPRQFNFEKDLSRTTLPESRPVIPVAKNEVAIVPKITAAAAVVIDDSTGTVLWSKNPDDVRSLASITKLISALVILDCNPNWSQTTTIQEADDIYSSHLLNAGETLTADDLWHAGLIGSSNGAINALARIACPDDPASFVLRMNEKAKELGLTTFQLVEPTGLDANNVGSAIDVARLLQLATQHDKIANTLAIGEYYIEPQGVKTKRRVWSTNWLLTNWVSNQFDPKHIIGKTGYIGDSGYNFVVRIGRNEQKAVRVVVLGAKDNESRFTEARDLANWAFGNYRWPNEN